MKILPRTALAFVLAAALLLASAAAQAQRPGGATRDAPVPDESPTPAAPARPAPAAPAAPAPAAEPVSISLEIYVVSQITRDDGTREERFAEATEARPGQTVEYRLFVRNVSQETLPAGIVVVTGPVPEGTQYVPNSATPSSDDVLTEFSADGAGTFSEPPVIVTRDDTRSVADPTAYDTIRWTVLVDLEPDQEIPLVYRVIVR
jgi:uncharacterized repeat protein (TIGR01451 family)